jgi:hypothetical protein
MPLEPTLSQILDAAFDARLLDLHTALPGKVKIYNPATQTADVQPTVMRAVLKRDGDRDLEELPVIPNVPVGWPRGGGYSLQFPLLPGDHVWLIFSEAAIAQWRESGSLSEPGDLRRHDLSYPIALPCVAPNAGALAPVVGSEAVLDGPTQIRLGGLLADYVALSTLVTAELTALKSAISGAATVPNDGGAAFKAALVAALSAWPGSVAATKVKAE